MCRAGVQSFSLKRRQDLKWSCGSVMKRRTEDIGADWQTRTTNHDYEKRMLSAPVTQSSLVTPVGYTCVRFIYFFLIFYRLVTKQNTIKKLKQ